MKKSIVLASISVLAFLSCTHEDKMFVKDVDSEIVTIYASAEGVPEVRNVIDDGSLSITWTSGDAINVFFGASESSKFVTSQSGEVAQFKGSIDVVTGGGEGLDDDTSLWGIYPYDEANTCDGTYVTLTLPAVQPAAENTFANALFPQIARSRNFYMSFYNLCGCFRFSVTAPDIRYVTFAGNNNEIIAGKVSVSMNTTPVVHEVISGETELKMYAPDGGYFVPGVHYYLVVFPGTFSEGMTITYYKDSSCASYRHSKSYTLGRGVVSRFAGKDAGLTFEDIPLVDWEEGDKISGEI